MELVRNAPHQRFGVVRAVPPVRVYAEELFLQVALGHAVKVVERRHRAPADEDGRSDVCLGEVENFPQFVPIGDFRKIHGLHGRARHDHAVEAAVFDLFEGLVEAVEVRRLGVLGAVGLRVHEGDVDLQGGVGKQAHELRFGLHLGRHEVQEGDLDGTDVLRRRPVFFHDENFFRAQNGIGGDVFIDDDGHKFASLFVFLCIF